MANNIHPVEPGQSSTAHFDQMLARMEASGREMIEKQAKSTELTNKLSGDRAAASVKPS